LGNGSRFALAERAADHAQNFHGQDRLAGNENALLVSVGVWRDHHKSVVVYLKKIVRKNAFEDFAVAEPESDPETRHFRAREKSEAFRGDR